MGDDGEGEHRSLLDRTLGGARRTLNHQVTGSARSVIEELEPHLIAETVPNIVEALIPDLVDRVVPEILDGIFEHLATTTAPQLVERLTPELADEVVPEVLERLRPWLETEFVPKVLDGLTPYLVSTTVPQIVDGLLPRLNAEVVPAVLDGIADDPRIRHMVRDQSLGAAIDAVEAVRRLLASADDTAERVVRRLLLREGDVAEPLPPDQLAPERSRSYAGLVSRLAGSVADLALVSFVGAATAASVLAVLDAVVDTIPQGVAAALAAGVALIGPAYLVVSWVLVGRTLGAFVAGYAVVRLDGSRLSVLRAVARALLALVVPVVWVAGMLLTVVDPRRRGLLDRVVGSATPYVGPRSVAPPAPARRSTRQVAPPAPLPTIL